MYSDTHTTVSHLIFKVMTQVSFVIHYVFPSPSNLSTNWCRFWKPYKTNYKNNTLNEIYAIIILTWTYPQLMTWKHHCFISTVRILMTDIKKTHSLLKIINTSSVDLPAPSSLSSWWIFGSLLGVCLAVQILTGSSLAMHYTSDTATAFNSVTHICHDINYG